jgi:hypothetical protein
LNVVRQVITKQKKVIDEQLDKIRDDLVTSCLNDLLPLLEGDKCIQIGTTIQIYGMDTKLDIIFTLKSAVIPEKPMQLFGISIQKKKYYWNLHG